MATINSTSFSGETLEIIAFRLHDQEFCVKTTTIREIRGWAPSTPIPHAPADVIGVMNLRGSVIPIIDLAYKLGMQSTVANERSAIVELTAAGIRVAPGEPFQLGDGEGGHVRVTVGVAVDDLDLVAHTLALAARA